MFQSYNARNSISTGAASQTPLRKLTPRPPSWILGVLLLRGGESEKGERKKERRNGNGNGREASYANTTVVAKSAAVLIR